MGRSVCAHTHVYPCACAYAWLPLYYLLSTSLIYCCIFRLLFIVSNVPMGGSVCAHTNNYPSITQCITYSTYCCIFSPLSPATSLPGEVRVLTNDYPSLTKYVTHSTYCVAFSCITANNTGWQRPIGRLKLQVIFRKKATNYRAPLRKMTYNEMTYRDKTSCGSSPPSTHPLQHRFLM